MNTCLPQKRHLPFVFWTISPTWAEAMLALTFFSRCLWVKGTASACKGSMHGVVCGPEVHGKWTRVMVAASEGWASVKLAEELTTNRACSMQK